MSEEFKTTIPEEVAKVDFERFAKFARLKVERKRNKNDRADVDEMRDAMIEDIMDGVVTIDDAGKPTIHTPDPELPTITFKFRPTFLVARSMDSQKKDADVAKNVGMIAEAVCVAPARLYALEFRDMEVVQRVFTLFLVR